ncbi:unnamed protein product [Amoebophrya sp. A25]|nr:unnamed protein product [Amoebophrya sp. A25]|eukprot:GSA25T00023477001.1
MDIKQVEKEVRKSLSEEDALKEADERLFASVLVRKIVAAALRRGNQGNDQGNAEAKETEPASTKAADVSSSSSALPSLVEDTTCLAEWEESGSLISAPDLEVHDTDAAREEKSKNRVEVQMLPTEYLASNQYDKSATSLAALVVEPLLPGAFLEWQVLESRLTQERDLCIFAQIDHLSYERILAIRDTWAKTTESLFFYRASGHDGYDMSSEEDDADTGTGNEEVEEEHPEL